MYQISNSKTPRACMTAPEYKTLRGAKSEASKNWWNKNDYCNVFISDSFSTRIVSERINGKWQDRE